MTLEKSYKPNEPHVIYEEIDGEVVLVNLETGSYYSIDNIGAIIWNSIDQRQPIDKIVEAIEAQYSGERLDIEHGIQQWLTHLAAENLIVPANGSAQTAAATPVTSTNGNRPPFETPVLNKYTDMEDLLLLDPIHDVDESGWPNTNPNNA